MKALLLAVGIGGLDTGFLLAVNGGESIIPSLTQGATLGAVVLAGLAMFNRQIAPILTDMVSTIRETNRMLARLHEKLGDPIERDETNKP